ncbi:hypothetical protein ACFIOZ_09635 [Vreelandella sp. F11]|uniref:hypothetical protein n=1 Tax=Vreelandella sp. F11 TaxID=3394751 RepID=UPI0036DAFD55
MKMLNAALFIALTLASGMALAERGSVEGNRIISPESTLTKQQDREINKFSPSEVPARNR